MEAARGHLLDATQGSSLNLPFVQPENAARRSVLLNSFSDLGPQKEEPCDIQKCIT